jgi:type II restriction enzyme
MNLQLDPSLADGYASPSQIARRITEPWAEGNLYCLACLSPRLESLRANTAVLDLRCPRCQAEYQLKSKAGPFGPRVQNSAYEVKIRAIQQGRVPHYAFLQYSRRDWVVSGLFVIPAHFVTPAIVERRNPLGPNARRAGWVGSNLLLGALPLEARVTVAAGSRVLARQSVRRQWKQFAFLGDDSRARGGWGADVLYCVRRHQRETGASEFTLRAFYSRFDLELANRHPANQHIRDKIRQQLQVLREGGVLRFLGGGRYQIIR